MQHEAPREDGSPSDVHVTLRWPICSAVLAIGSRMQYHISLVRIMVPGNSCVIDASERLGGSASCIRALENFIFTDISILKT